MVIGTNVKVLVVFPVIPPGNFIPCDKAGAVLFTGVAETKGLVNLCKQPAPGDDRMCP
jgi:hypothetical protein